MTPLWKLEVAAASIPNVSKVKPKVLAANKGTLPLGIGLSGRSIASSLASNTSFMTTPPPYKPKVESTSAVGAKSLKV